MNIIFFTRPDKLKDIGIEYSNLKLEKNESNTIGKKSIDNNTIYIAFDGNGIPLEDNYKTELFSLLNVIIEEKDYFIVYHTNQALCITTFINDNVDKNKCYLDVHELYKAVYYKMIPDLLVKTEAINNFVETLKVQRENKIDLNTKLTILHKLLGDKQLDENENEIAKDALGNYQKLMNVNKIDGLKQLRDALLKDYV